MLRLARLVVLIMLFALPAFAQTEAKDSLRISQDTTLARAFRPEKKSPKGAAFRSLAIPGWGQYYNGQKIKAALALAAELGEIGTAIYWNVQANGTDDARAQFIYRDYRNQALWFLAGTILVSMLDAYVDAHLFDFDEGPSLEENTANLPPDTRFALRLHIRL